MSVEICRKRRGERDGLGLGIRFRVKNKVIYRVDNTFWVWVKEYWVMETGLDMGNGCKDLKMGLEHGSRAKG